jgi:hypothetical protein
MKRALVKSIDGSERRVACALQGSSLRDEFHSFVTNHRRLWLAHAGLDLQKLAQGPCRREGEILPSPAARAADGGLGNFNTAEGAGALQNLTSVASTTQPPVLKHSLATPNRTV